MVVGEFSQDADVVIIGSGPAGYSCAFRAAELGLRPVIVDRRNQLGGVCLHTGCIPSKVLLHIASTLDLVRDAAQFGIHFDHPRINIDAVRVALQGTIDKLAKGLDARARGLGVERIVGEAAFDDSRNIRVSGGHTFRLHFRRAVICTGATPLPHPALPYDDVRVLTPWKALQLPCIPATLLVIGSHYEAMEIANIYAALGSAVTLACEHDSLIPDADADLLRPLQRQLTKKLKSLSLGVCVTEANLGEQGVTVAFSGTQNPSPQSFEQVVVLAGHEPSIHTLNLKTTAVRLDDSGFIAVDRQLRSTDPRIYAAGDVTGHPLLADTAIHQGRICAESLAGWGSEYDPRAIPFVAFTNPQIAWCGLTEMQATAQGPCAVKKIPWGASGRAVGMGASDGLTKIIYEPDTQLVLGVGIVGVGAAEMIGEAVLAIEMGAVLTDIASSIHPHPSISELLSEAAQQAELVQGRRP